MKLSEVKKILSIAGSDSGGGAGIQADIKTISAHDHYAMTAVAAVTAQNTLGVRGCLAVPTEMLSAQIDSIFDDLRPNAVKTGMLMNYENVEAVAERLLHYGAENIVCDPVMMSTSGAKLLSDNGIRAYIEKLIPVADIITPNIPEAELLSGVKILSEKDVYAAAAQICSRTKGTVLIKGGHLNCCDYLFHGSDSFILKGEKINTTNSHGTGCTLSSAIACRLAEGKSVYEAAKLAKEYVTAAISAGFDIGNGSGPLWHNVRIEGK